MQATAADPVGHCAPWLLNLKALKASLGCYRLPSYSHALAYLEGYKVRGRVASLWHGVFGDDLPPGNNTFDLECELVGRVYRELFPVDLAYMDGLLQCDEDPLDFGIPIEGLGVPWEVDAFDELHHAVLPVLATLAQTEELEIPTRDVDGFRGAVVDWWDDQGREPPEWHTGSIGGLQIALRCLDPPLDALADVITVIQKDSGNIFLDAPNCYWQYEYGIECGLWCWCPECIKRLTKVFDRVRPVAERLRRYYDWYDDEHPGSKARVLEALATLVSGRYEIRDGELITIPGEPTDA